MHMAAAARGYLPSHRAFPPFDRYQFILLGEQRHMHVNNLPKVKAKRPGIEVHRPNHYIYTTRPQLRMSESME